MILTIKMCLLRFTKLLSFSHTTERIPMAKVTIHLWMPRLLGSWVETRRWLMRTRAYLRFVGEDSVVNVQSGEKGHLLGTQLKVENLQVLFYTLRSNRFWNHNDPKLLYLLIAVYLIIIHTLSSV